MSGRCGGLHCPGCGKGGGGAALAVLAAIVIIAIIARPVAHAADAAGRVVAEVLEVAGITLASAAGLAVLAAAAYGARRMYRWQASARQALPRHILAALDGSEDLKAAQQAVLNARRPAAIEAPRLVVRGLVIRGETRREPGRRP